MNFEDEIKKQRDQLFASQQAAEQKKRNEEILKNAIEANGMTAYSPILMQPSANLQQVIQEALPYMKFTQPKIVRTMPNNTAMIRFAKKHEHPDTYSFDVMISSDGGKNPLINMIWFFSNGAVSFVKHSGTSNANDYFNNGKIVYFEDVGHFERQDSISSTASEVRSKIINLIASMRL